MDDSQNTPAKPCCARAGFNYCFWAKFLVGVPALGIAGYTAAGLFSNPVLQPVAFVVTVMFLVWAAIKVDRMPVMQKPIFTKKKGD